MRWHSLTVAAVLLIARSATAQVITIDTRPADIVTPAPLDVRNRDAVDVTIKHTPVVECTVETKPEPLKPDANPILTMIQVATKLFAGGGPAPCTVAPVPAPPRDDEAARIEAQLNRLLDTVKTLENDPEKYQERHQKMAERIRALSRCQTADNKPACTDAATFAPVRQALEVDLKLLLETVPPSTESAALLVDVLKKSLAARLASNPAPGAAADWLASATGRLDCYSRTLESFVERRKVILAARDEMRKALDVIIALQKAQLETTVKLRREREAKVTATATCTNLLTKQVDVAPISFIITYHNRPVLLASAGLLYSTGDKRVLGSSAVKSGTNADGTVAFKTVIGETDAASFQIVPFSYLHWMPVQYGDFDIGGALGLGLNANNGDKQIEYMLGPSLGYRSVYIVVGVHRLRRPEPGNGFTVGDTLPDKFPAVPIRRDVVNVLGIALTYKLPF